PWFEALTAAAADQHLAWTPPDSSCGPGDGDVPQGIPVEIQLAGSELANFAAFLRPRWRANDWMWGRLDAVPTLVDLLLTPTTLRAWLSGDGSPADPVRAIEDLVVGTDLGEAWQAWLRAEVWQPYA